jgi:hypothetical protein
VLFDLADRGDRAAGEDTRHEELAKVEGRGPHWSAIDFFKATMTIVEVGYRA